MKRAYIIAATLVLVLLTACDMKLSSLKREQFEVLKRNVVEILGEEYKVKKIRISNEGYSDDAKNEYIVDFSFDLAKPLAFLPSSNLPGKLIFQRDSEGEWNCSFNSGNPSELFNLLQ